MLARITLLTVVSLLIGSAATADDRVEMAKAYLTCNIHASMQLSSGAGDPEVLADEALARCEDQANRLVGLMDRRTLLELRAIARDTNVATIEHARMGFGKPFFDAMEASPLRCASCGRSIEGLAAAPPKVAR